MRGILAVLAAGKQIVGAHVAPERPLEAAREVGADCVQIFLSDPQGWEKPDPRGDADELHLWAGQAHALAAGMWRSADNSFPTRWAPTARLKELMLAWCATMSTRSWLH